jgi:hypothetical protein
VLCTLSRGTEVERSLADDPRVTRVEPLARELEDLLAAALAEEATR